VNIRKSLPEKLAYFSGTKFVEEVESKFKEPIDAFIHLAKVAAIHSFNVCMLLRELRTANKLQKSFELRFTIFFDIYVVISLEHRLSKVFHFWPHWKRVKNSPCLDFYNPNALFSVLEFCSWLKVCFEVWIFDMSKGKIKNRMCETGDLKFVDWICKIGTFKQFFCGVGVGRNLGFPGLIKDKYDLKNELGKVMGNLRYESDKYKELIATLTETKKKPEQKENGGNKVPWDEDDPNFYENKKAIAEAVKVGHEHEIDELVNLDNDYGKLRKLLRKSACIIKYMSTKSPQCRGRVNKFDWRNYLRNQIKKAQIIASAVEKEKTSRIP